MKRQYVQILFENDFSAETVVIRMVGTNTNLTRKIVEEK